MKPERLNDNVRILSSKEFSGLLHRAGVALRREEQEYRFGRKRRR